MAFPAEFQGSPANRYLKFSIETIQLEFSQTAKVEIKSILFSRIKCLLITTVRDLLAVSAR